MACNVLSELRRPRPRGAVLAWLRRVDDSELRVAAITIQAGIEIARKQNEARAAELEAWLDQIATLYNVLDMDGRTFRLWARLMHGRGDHLIEDAMIAATARAHGRTVVTRNTRDFAPFGVGTLNPFKAA